MEQIVLVNKEGIQIGIADKLSSHHSNTPLHRAFSCYVFDKKGKLLITQRSLEKKVWPGVWTNSVCGHPAPGEDVVEAIKRRLNYELNMKAKGFQVVLPDYRYKTPPFNGVIENEICPVYIAWADSTPFVNPGEVKNFRWVNWDEYVKSLENDQANAYSWWSKDQLKQLKKNKEFLRLIKR